MRTRIRVVHHLLHVHLLVAVRTRLLLTHNAPAADAELVEAGEGGGVKEEKKNTTDETGRKTRKR